jgi:drug/metabolite transporter (DMT)-like permease
MRSSYLKGVLAIVAATILLSLSGVFVRLTTTTDPWQINSFRAGAMVVALLAFLLAGYGRQAWCRFAALDRRALAAVSVFFALGSTLYIMALSRTSVANVACLTATAPVFAAALAWLLLGERTGLVAWAATGAALFGVYVIFRDRVGAGDETGNIIALATAVCFACQTVALRKYRTADLVPAVCVGGIMVCVGIPIVRHVPLVDGRDLVLLAAMGVVQLAVPVVLLVRGARYVPAVQMALIALLDVPLNPLWAWIGVGETPTAEAVVGGRHHRRRGGRGRGRPAAAAAGSGSFGRVRTLGVQIGLAGGASRRRRW